MVDAKLRVYGVSGLRVCDASIFPYIVSGHTVCQLAFLWGHIFLTVFGCGIAAGALMIQAGACYATAEKLADIIKEECAA